MYVDIDSLATPNVIGKAVFLRIDFGKEVVLPYENKYPSDILTSDCKNTCL